jgi:hypothetical protein
VPVEQALQSLDSEANTQIAWAFGDVLRAWALRDDWEACIPLQHLAAHPERMQGWNLLVERTRQALANDVELPAKARQLLLPKTIQFNDVMEDLIAEMHGAQYLHLTGHADIHFLSDAGAIHTDLQSRIDNQSCVTEVKNLREPRALTKVAFTRWHRNRTMEPERYAFTASALDLDDPRGDLTSEQQAAVIALIDELPEWTRPSNQIRTLKGGRRISVSVSNGTSTMITHGGGPFRVDGPLGIVAEAKRGLLLKLLEQVRKALSQLYAEPVPHEFRRLLFVRWKPPEELRVCPEGVEQIRNSMQDELQEMIRASFPHFAVVIAHTSEDLENAPRVQWA